MNKHNQKAWSRIKQLLSTLGIENFTESLTETQKEAVLIAARTNDISSLAKLLSGYPQNIVQETLNEALQAAVVRGHAEAVLWLLKAKADPKARNSQGQTALFLLVERAYGRLHSCLIAQYLLAAHSEVNALDKKHNTPLLILSAMPPIDNLVKIAELLLKAGAFLDVSNTDDNTPFRNAANQGHLALLDLFIKYVNFKNIRFWAKELAILETESNNLDKFPSLRLVYGNLRSRLLKKLRHNLPTIMPFTSFETDVHKLIRRISFSLKSKSLRAIPCDTQNLPLHPSLSPEQVSTNTDPYFISSYNKKKILWELQQRRSAALILKKQQFTTITVANVRITCKDFRQDEDYQFIVHTTKSHASDLRVTRQTDAFFAQTNPYISASLIDKYTPGAGMAHQGNILPKVMLILSVSPHSVYVTSPEDFDSLQNIEEGRYAQKKIELRSYMDAQLKSSRLMAQLAREWSNHEYLPLDPFTVRCSFAIVQDKHFPFLSPKELSDLTLHRYYNELLIGKGLNGLGHLKITAVAIEETDMLEFNDCVYPQLNRSEQQSAQASLEELNRFGTVVLLNTDAKGYLRKQTDPLLRKTEQLNQSLSLNTLQLWKNQQNKDKLIQKREQIYQKVKQLVSELPAEFRHSRGPTR